MSSALAPLAASLVAFGVIATASGEASAADYGPQGGEYPISGLLRGDQVFPSISIGKGGGYVVWQDNATDGDGTGISARRLDASLLGNLGAFRINEQGQGDQEAAKVAMLANAGAVVVWQGGASGAKDVFARLISADGTFVSGDLLINSHTADNQMQPAVAALGDGNAVVVWSSFGQDGDLLGVFGQIVSPSGVKVGSEFRVNESSRFNQRTPSVRALSGGGFVVSWISEQQRFENSVDVFARVYSAGGTALGGEFRVSTTSGLTANPALVDASDGGFIAGWSQRETTAENPRGWDVYARAFDAKGNARGTPERVNSHDRGNHFAPQLARVGDSILIVWTSSRQDASGEGVFGRYLDSAGRTAGTEFQVNGFAESDQSHPTVSSDASGQFVAVWSSFIGGATGVDLFAQRYAGAPIRPQAPFIAALSATRLSVTWPEAGEKTVVGYDVYVDGATTPLRVTENSATVTGLAPGSSHSVRLAYRFVNGERSASSEASTGKTWGSDENLDGLPDDWQEAHWGANPAKWPDPRGDDDVDGASNLQEFLAGTEPRNASSALRMQIRNTEQGTFLGWNTQPGFIYQVQANTDLAGEWVDVGVPRFAASTSDAILLEGAARSTYYRVKRVR